jgi:protein phosphatase
VLRVAEHFERSDTGRQRRENEDSFYARAPLFAVADGMGGAQAGEVASHIAVEVLQEGRPEGDGSVEERLRERVREANTRINAVSRSDDQRAGMGTTLTVAYVGEDELSVAHVGDSRLYRLRDGRFERLTEDHSLVEELVRQGKITPQEADEHPQRSIITRALGPEEDVQADSFTWPARAGDVYLVCSDGLTSMVPEARIGEILGSSKSLASAGRSLIDAANEAGGRDNITVVLFRLESVDRGGPSRGSGPVPATAEHQSTSASATAVHTEDVQRAVADAEAKAVPRRMPRPPRPAGAPVRRRRRRISPAIPVVLILVAALVLGAYFASQTVYFLGGSNDGFVAIYRGIPYKLPAGLKLYRQDYESGVPVDELSAHQRAVLAAHKWRSHDDALDFVRKLETGQVQP